MATKVKNNTSKRYSVGRLLKLTGVSLVFTIILLFQSGILNSICSVENNFVYATSYEDRYNSGYDHGCDDAKINDPDDQYINQPEKGPSYHTNAFMDGYYDGYDNCSKNTDDTDNNNDNKFVVEVTFVDTNDRGPNDVKVYIEEYPRYSKNSIDLLDAIYGDDPVSESDRKYTTNIEMPSGLIEEGERFHVCIEDLDNNFDTKCYSLTNGPENEPEKLTIRV